MTAKRKIYDPYVELLDKFNKAGVDYVVIGMSGINYYARSAMETFGTQDYDIFLRPAIENAARALRIFHELGYETTAGDEALTDKRHSQCKTPEPDKAHEAGLK